jgi:hypothetical protein
LYGNSPSQLDEGLTSVNAIGEQRFLVQKMGGGTWCDLIHKNRRIEIQFQCDPSGGDRIAWVKETSTCSYLMVVHTPKLCNDLAFLPVKRVGEGEGVNEIVCQKVEAPEIGERRKEQEQQERLELPSGISETSDATSTIEESTPSDATTENPDSADYLEFIIPSGPLPSALQLLEETIIAQISVGKFLRPDGIPYSPDDEEPLEYRVELIDDVEDRVFGVLKVKITKGANVETEIVSGEGSPDVLPESLTKELKDWVEGHIPGQPEEKENDNNVK